MNRIRIVLLSSLLVACSPTPHSFTLEALDLPQEIASFQQQVLGQLTGENPIASPEGDLRIESRWNQEEKDLAAAYLTQMIAEMGLEPQEQAYVFPHSNPGIDLLIEPFRGRNIYTVLPATVEEAGYIILGAHYDTGAEHVPGAIDNASGMTLIASVLKQLLTLETRTLNVLVIFFDQEEEESVGSAAFVRLLKKEKYKVHSAHTFDMVGWDSDNNREIELELPNAYLENLYRKHADRLNIPLYTTDINSSDHYSFIKEGFPAVGISQAYAKRDNSGKKDTPEDRYELVNFDYLLSTTNLVYEVVKDVVTSADQNEAE